MEELFVYSVLWCVGYEKYDEYRDKLDSLFLDNPENEILLDLEGREYKDAMLHLCHLLESEDFDVDEFGKQLMDKLRFIYEDSTLMEFARKMPKIWNRLPEKIDCEEPFHTLNFADDCLSYGDEQQCRELYEKALYYYENRGEKQ